MGPFSTRHWRGLRTCLHDTGLDVSDPSYPSSSFVVERPIPRAAVIRHEAFGDGELAVTVVRELGPRGTLIPTSLGPVLVRLAREVNVYRALPAPLVYGPGGEARSADQLDAEDEMTAQSLLQAVEVESVAAFECGGGVGRHDLSCY